MQIPRKTLKRIINLIVVLIVAIVGFIKVKHPFSYLIGVPVSSWVVYLLCNAMCTDILFGETLGCSEKNYLQGEISLLLIKTFSISEENQMSLT